jgi:hypothetical protein
VHFFFLREVVDAAAGRARGRAPGQLAGEKDAELAQKLVQLQPFLAVFPQECEGQLASSGPTEHLPRCQCAGASWSPVAAALGCGDAKPARLRIGNHPPRDLGPSGTFLGGPRNIHCCTVYLVQTYMSTACLQHV